MMHGQKNTKLFLLRMVTDFFWK